MKSASEKVHYFSAYPLKALNLPEEEYQLALQARSALTLNTANRVRVLPMANPYRERDFIRSAKKETLQTSDNQH